ncbi:hypothetical protein ABK040_007518 [Willaertia magna]
MEKERPSPTTLFNEVLANVFDVYKAQKEDKENISLGEAKEILHVSGLKIDELELETEYDKEIGRDNLANKEQFITVMKALIRNQKDEQLDEELRKRRENKTLDFQQQAMLEVKREKYIQTFNRYNRDHPLLHQILFDFLTTVLVYKPNNVFTFAQEYFTNLAKVQQKKKGRRKLLVFSGAILSSSNFAFKVISTFPQDVERAVSHTTREKRPEEIEGIHHFFVPSHDLMKHMMKESHFYEIVQIGNDYYGNSKGEIDSILEKEKVCIAFANLKGVQQLKLNLKETDIDVSCVYIKPTSTETFEITLQKVLENEEKLNDRRELIVEESKQQLSEFYDLVLDLDDQIMSEEDIPLEYEMPQTLYEFIFNFISK